MQYSVVHLKYSFDQEWEQDLLEQALCDVGFEVFDGENAYIQTSILEDNQEAIETLIADTEGVELLSIELCEDINWNAQWEAEHEAIELPLVECKDASTLYVYFKPHEDESLNINAFTANRVTIQV